MVQFNDRRIGQITDVGAIPASRWFTGDYGAPVTPDFLQEMYTLGNQG